MQIRLIDPAPAIVEDGPYRGAHQMRNFNRFDERKLREDALKAFVKALHTDRMVAVTGAMTTRALGYPGWNDFVSAYAIIARDLAKEVLKERVDNGAAYCHTDPILEGIASRADDLIKTVDKENAVNAARMRGRASSPEGLPVADKRVSMWTLHESFRAVDREMRENRSGLVLNNVYQQSALTRFENRVAAIFRSRTFADGTGAAAAAVRPLIASLGIKRVATLNYDLELERAFMIRRDEADLINFEEKAVNAALAARLKKRVARSDWYAAKHILDGKHEMASVQAFIGKAETGKPIELHVRNRLSRTMGNGIHVESDVVDRERPDRLFEFAIGSAETDRHILHLHGRVDAPETMVANIREYDRLYRLDDLYRDPFDHGLRMMMGGNPILFVGLGMEEPEVNAPLQYLVSNVPVRRPAPAFLIWGTDKTGPERERFKAEKRLDFFTRLGVYILFDDDLLLSGDTTEIALGDASQNLVASLDRLPALVKRVDRRIDRTADVWRSIDKRLEEPQESPGPYRMWGSEELKNMVSDRLSPSGMPKPNGLPLRFDLKLLADSNASSSEARNQQDSDCLIFAAAPNGYGRGELSEYIAQLPEQPIQIGESLLKATHRQNRLLINAGFSYDSDALLSGIARFLAHRLRMPLNAQDPNKAELRQRLANCRERHFADASLFDTQDDVLIIINGVDRFFGFDGTPLSAEFDHMLRCANRKNDAGRPVNTKVQFLLLGTNRTRQYCEALKLKLQLLPERARVNRDPIIGKIDLESSYLDWIRTRFEARASREDERSAAGADASGDTNSALAIERARRDRRVTPAAEAAMRRAASIDRDARYRTFYDAHLAPTLLKALGLNCPATFEVLRTLCFIGTPVEATVLLHAPKVHAILAERNTRTQANDTPLGTDLYGEPAIRRQLAAVIHNLNDLGLLLKLDSHEPISGDTTALTDVSRQDAQDAAPMLQDAEDDTGWPTEADAEEILWQRYGLHRTIATYLRDRHGAPINDAKLATTFNISLFMSEPSDTTTPEAGFHDELGNLVDSLTGGWHDMARIRGDDALSVSDKAGTVPTLGEQWFRRLPLQPQDPGQGSAEDLFDLYIHHADRDRAIKSLAPRARREAAACLRAALSVIRGYYSTGALLKLDRGSRLASADRDGALTEHAQRLDRLITSFGDMAIARKMARAAIGNEAEAQRFLGPEPLYADDLVWLHNERAVVALAQGDLFDAREALSAAQRVNEHSVEAQYHGHNWRRIAINMVSTRIERGSLKPAERLLDQIEVSIGNAPWCNSAEGHCADRVGIIRSLFKDDNPSPPLRGTSDCTREEMFIVAMSTSYRGLIAHMRARFDEAKTHYEIGIRMLRQLGEQRAYAHFQRQLASLEAFFGDKAVAQKEIEFAIAAAQASKQMDILHRSRIVRADLTRLQSRDEGRRRQALQDIKDALSYAAVADCYRLRIEASASLARHMRIGGDYDTALRYGADAMTIAARYGHSLQKTSLRIELGRILDARGDPVSGKALLDQAIAIGTTKGYNHALERVRRAQVAIPSIPHRTDIPISG